MTSGPLMPQIITFAIPLALTGLLQLIYNAADMMVVGRYAGSTSLAAVGATSMLVNLTVNLFIGLATGSGVVTAKYIGADDNEKVRRTVHTTMLLGAVSGILVMSLGILLSPLFLKWMDTPSDIIDLSVTYLRIYFAGAPANMIYNYGAAVLRASGDSKRPFYFLTASGLINIGLNLLFVIKFNMDVAGVAYATIISQYISATCVVIALKETNRPTRLSLKKLRIYKEVLTEIIRIGLPAGIQGCFFSISNVIIQSSINSFGSIAVAGNTAAANIDGIIYVCCNSISQSSMTFSSQNLGARKYKRITKTFADCILLVMIVSLVLCGVFYGFRKFFLGIFTTDSAVIKMGTIRLGIMAATYWLNSLMDVTTGQLRGIGKSVSPMIMTLAGVCVFRIIWIFTIFRSYHTMQMLFYSYPVSWAITEAALIITYFVERNKLLKKDAAQS